MFTVLICYLGRNTVAMKNSVPALLRLTPRGPLWRVAVILPGRILWRCYSRAEYPEPDDAARRCLAGLNTGGIQPQTGQCPEKRRHGHTEPQHRLPTVNGDETMQHPRLLAPARRLRAAWWGWL